MPCPPAASGLPHVTEGPWCSGPGPLGCPRVSHHTRLALRSAGPPGRTQRASRAPWGPVRFGQVAMGGGRRASSGHWFAGTHVCAFCGPGCLPLWEAQLPPAALGSLLPPPFSLHLRLAVPPGALHSPSGLLRARLPFQAPLNDPAERAACPAGARADERPDSHRGSRPSPSSELCSAPGESAPRASLPASVCL